jgi:hypothetical protein
MARWKREFTAGKRMADRSRELRHKGANVAHHFDGGEPRRRETPTRFTACRLLKSVCREIVAALTGRFGGAFRRSASRVGLCAGKQGNLTSNLLAPVSLLRSLEPSHATMRRIFVAWVARFSHLCVLIIQSCRPRSIRTMPAKHFNSFSSVAVQSWIGGAIPGSLHALEEVKLASTSHRTQRSGLAGLSASVDESAHSDVHCHAQRQKREQHRRSTVTH